MQCFQRQLAIAGCFDLHTNQIQKICSHLAVEGVVIHHQNTPPFELWIALQRGQSRQRWGGRSGQHGGRRWPVGLENFKDGVEEHGFRHRLDQQALQTQALSLTQHLVPAIRGDHEDCRCGGQALFLADAARGFQSVHAGHAPVHQYQAIGRAAARCPVQGSQGLLAAVHRIGAHAKAAHHGAENLTRGGVVVHDQHAVCAAHTVQLRACLRRGGGLHLHGEQKGAADSNPALHLDLAAHDLH